MQILNLILMDEAVARNQDDAAPSELLKFSWNIISLIFGETKKELIEENVFLKADAKSTDDLVQGIKVAREGRIESVFLAKGVCLWGKVNADGNPIRLSENSTGSKYLLHYLAAETLLKQGDVYIFNTDKISLKSAFAAEFRY